MFVGKVMADAAAFRIPHARMLLGGRGEGRPRCACLHIYLFDWNAPRMAERRGLNLARWSGADGKMIMPLEDVRACDIATM